MLSTVLPRLRGRGPAEIARLAVINVRHALAPSAIAARRADGAFDRRWGTDTSTGVSTRELGFDAWQIEECRRYDPSGEQMLRDPVAALGIDPADYDFIDYGAGKGRAMMLALQLGFASVRGIELSDRLCGVARDNLARFEAQGGAVSGGEIVCADATAVTPRGRHILAYFYNPFGATIMAGVRTRLEAARAGGAQSVTVVYANPVHAEVFGDAPGWRRGPATLEYATFVHE